MGKHLPAIDGLRAFAVLAVVAYHAGLPLSAGFVGVDVFFVISGYVITRMLLSEPQIDLLAFYARRVRRILPALLVVVAVVLALSAAMLPADLQSATNRSAMAAMAMGANVWFQWHTGYFDAASDTQPLLHLWSLAVEEQFYFVWPLLLIAFRRRPWVLALLAVGSLWLSESLGQNAAFYSMPSRFWELAVGGLIAFAPVSRLGGVGWAGLPVLALAVMVPSQDFPGLGALMPVAGTALVLYGVHCGGKILPLELAPVRYVGLVSYSFYLWHWPLLAIAKAYAFDPPTLADNLALCGLAFVLACLSYHFIEQPFRKGEPRAKAIAAGVAACLVLAGCSAGMNEALRRSDSLSARTALDGPPEAACQGVDVTCEADVVLWGDSHARQWQPLAETFGTVHQVTMGGCLASAMPGERRQFAECAHFNRKALAIAQNARTVVIGGFWLNRMAAYPNASRQDFESVLAALSRQRVIVIGPTPELHVAPQRCIASGDYGPCSLPRAEFDNRAVPVSAYLRETVARFPNATYIEPADFFCTDTRCPMMRGGYSLYWDDDHITATAAREFARSRGTRTTAQ